MNLAFVDQEKNISTVVGLYKYTIKSPRNISTPIK